MVREVLERPAKPGSRGYIFATQSVKYLKGELFMEEK